MLCVGLGSEQADAGTFKEVRDWWARCSNGLTCSLEYNDSAGDAMLRTIAIERISAPDAPVNLLLGFGEALSHADAEMAELILRIDDDASFSFLLADGQTESDGWQWRIPAIEAPADLLTAMTDGIRMTAEIDGLENSAIEVSLAGVTAGLVFIDEAQGRLQRLDALETVGNRPVPDEARVREITAVADLPPEIRADFEDEQSDCHMEPDRFAAIGAFVVAEDDLQELIGAPCGPGGAYNQPYVLYSGLSGKFRPLALPTMTEEGPTTSRMAYNISYEPIDDRLTSFFKGRGIGDCGGYQAWAIKEDEYGLNLVLREERAKGECDGDYAGGPESWPLTWPR